MLVHWVIILLFHVYGYFQLNALFLTHLFAFSLLFRSMLLCIRSLDIPLIYHKLTSSMPLCVMHKWSSLVWLHCYTSLCMIIKFVYKIILPKIYVHIEIDLMFYICIKIHIKGDQDIHFLVHLVLDDLVESYPYSLWATIQQPMTSSSVNSTRNF